MGANFLSNQIVFSLAVNGSNIFAGTCYSGILRSTNNGMNWIQTSISNATIYDIIICGNAVLAGAGGVYRSTNNGLNWVQIQLDNQIVTSFAVNGNNIFAGTGNLGVYISSNNGLNWAQTSLNNQFINVMTSNEGIIYAGGMMDWGSVYFSTNNGQNWTQTSLTNQYIEEICVIGCDIFVATRNNGVYFSSDSGLNWVQKNEGLENLNVYSLVLTPDYIFARDKGKICMETPVV